MTEYDFSPEAYERHLATQQRISNWVVNTEERRPEFGNALKVLPRAASSASLAPPAQTALLPGQSVSSRHLADPRVLPHQQQLQYHYSHLQPQTQSQPQSRSSSRHRTHTSKKKHAATAYVVAVPPVNTHQPTYVYAPSGWVASAGLVIHPSKGSKTPLVYTPPGTQYQYPPQPLQQQQAYTSPSSGTYPPQATYLSPQSYVYPQTVPFPQPVAFHQPQAQPQQMYAVPHQPLGRALSKTVFPTPESGRKIKKKDKDRALRKSKSEMWR